MSEIQMPVVCPKCKSTDVREVSESIFQSMHYKYIDTKAIKYELTFDDSENFGDGYLQCDKCEYIYDQEVYDAWLEFV